MIDSIASETMLGIQCDEIPQRRGKNRRRRVKNLLSRPRINMPSKN